MMNVRQQHLIERAARRFLNPSLLDPALESGTQLPAPPLAPPAFATPAASPRSAVCGQSYLLETIEPVTLEALKRADLAVFDANRSRVIEEWRVIISSLRRQQPKRQAGIGMSNALMVTSSRPKEGKTFCSLNLAAAMANNGRAPILLVDLDAKPNALSTLLGLADRRGLLDLVRQPTLPLASVMVPTVVPNLHVLPLGSQTASGIRGSEAGITHSVIETLQRIARQLADSLLIFDTAPCLATGDAVALAPLVGQIAMIVEAETTQKHDLEAALSLLEPCRTITLVLNKARSQAPGHFGVEYYGYDGQGR